MPPKKTAKKPEADIQALLREKGKDAVEFLVSLMNDPEAKPELRFKAAEEILDLENAIDEKERELQNLHVKCLTAGECTAQVGMMFSDLASNLERVADHATNIAFSILEEDPEGDKPPKVELV